MPEFEQLPIIALTAKAMKGDREKSHRRRRLRLHHQAGRHRPAAVADAGLALPLGARRLAPCGEPRRRRPRLEQLEIDLLLEARLPPLRLRLPRVRAALAEAARLAARARRGPDDASPALQERVLHDPRVMERLLLDLSVNVTAMFRDPSFYLAFREQVVPLLRTYPFTRIWLAGCSTGEEVYSLAILLEEEGLYDRTRIYATDINEVVLEQRAGGRLPARQDAGVHAELHPGRRRARLLRVLRREYDGALFARSLMRQRRLRAAQPRHPTARSTSST